MKKILIFSLMWLVLVSCENQTSNQAPMSEMAQNTENKMDMQAIQWPSELLTDGENKKMQAYLAEYEKILREDEEGFGEEVIQEALRIKREEWIDLITKP